VFECLTSGGARTSIGSQAISRSENPQARLPDRPDAARGSELKSEIRIDRLTYILIANAALNYDARRKISNQAYICMNSETRVNLKVDRGY